MFDSAWWWHSNTKVLPFKEQHLPRSMYNLLKAIADRDSAQKLWEHGLLCLLQLFKQPWAGPAAVYTVRAGGRSLWRSLFFTRAMWYVCAARPTQTHLTAAWLAFLPHSVIMALLWANRLLFPRGNDLQRAGSASVKGPHFPPGHLAQPLISTITHHQAKMCTKNSSGQQLLSIENSIFNSFVLHFELISYQIIKGESKDWIILCFRLALPVSVWKH